MNKLKLVVPKGRIFAAVARLLEDSGIRIAECARQYAPHVSDPEIEVKIMKPQNIAQVVELGSHEAGFTGRDWIVETGARVAEVMDLGLDPVRIVAAAPAPGPGRFREEARRGLRVREHLAALPRGEGRRLSLHKDLRSDGGLSAVRRRPHHRQHDDRPDPRRARAGDHGRSPRILHPVHRQSRGHGRRLGPATRSRSSRCCSRPSSTPGNGSCWR